MRTNKVSMSDEPSFEKFFRMDSFFVFDMRALCRKLLRYYLLMDKTQLYSLLSPDEADLLLQFIQSTEYGYGKPRKNSKSRVSVAQKWLL